MLPQLETLKQTILHSEDKNELYRADLEIAEFSTEQFKKIESVISNRERIEIKGHLSLAASLLAICRDRQKDIGNRLRDDYKNNYNFRKAAKAMLKPETYSAINAKAQLPRADVKAESNDLRSEPFE